MAAEQTLHVLRWTLTAVAAVWALIGVCLFAFQRRLVFRPARQLIQPPLALSRLVEPVWIPGEGGRLHGWWVAQPASQARTTTLILPGAIGNLSHEADTILFAHTLGSNVLCIDYPGYGLSEGRPSEAAVFSAAKSGWNFLTEQKDIPPGQIVIFGRSLGGIPAIRLAAEQGCRGLVIHSGFLSIPDVAKVRYPVFPTRFFCMFGFDARRFARQVVSPTLFIHAVKDRRIPMVLGRNCYRLFRSRKRFLAVEGGHSGIAWTRAPAVRSAMEDLCSGQAQSWS